MGGDRPSLTVLVDARNVLRSQWPNIPEQDLVERCRSWAEARAVRAVAVFDGEAPGPLIGEQEHGRHLAVVGTGSDSADDWLTRAATELTTAKQRFWLVTSDRDLRTRAGEGAEKIVGGGSFARELTSGRFERS